MGLTYIDATVSNGPGTGRPVRFQVDSGATYSLLPEEIWKDLGLTPKRTVTVTLADGSTLARGVSECLLRIGADEAHSPVILGEAGDEALIGAVTLEILGLVLDPFKRELRTMGVRLA